MTVPQLALRKSPQQRRRRLTTIAAHGAIASLVVSGLTTGLATVATADAHNPDFGPNVTIFDDSMSTAAINQELRDAAVDMSGEVNHWTNKRRAFFFKPGTYGNHAYTGTVDDPSQIVNSEIGYYTSIAGLGLTPGEVEIAGALHVNAEQRADCSGSNPAPGGNGPWEDHCKGPGSLNNFWRSIANMTITPKQFPYGPDAGRLFPEGIVEPGRMRWAVSQAAPMRRVHIKGALTYMGRMGSHASGGFTSDSKIDDLVQTGSQQQFLHRNSSIGSYSEAGVWNMVFVGTNGAPVDDYPDSQVGVAGHTPTPGSPSTDDPEFAAINNKHANYGNTPISREAPFLTWNAADGYGVWVPGVRTNSNGESWTATDPGPGTRLSLDEFVVAKPGTNGSIDVAALNSAIASGKHILFTPGEYLLTEPLVVDRADTVVLGLGMATLRPINGTAAIKVGDVEGVKLAGLMLEAHTVKSDVLVEVGPRNATAGTASNPTTLTDLFFRIGGAQDGNVDTALEVNSHYALIDNIWSWRADHGDDADVNIGYRWERNPADVGARINGDNVTALGLFVEHYQKVQTEWNGENGRTIFYQSEIPYEPETQDQYNDRGREGYSSYKVDPSVQNHELFGAGVYSYFRWVDTVWAENGISVPKRPTVEVNRVVTRWLNGCIPSLSSSLGITGCADGKGGGIRHIVNDQGKESAGLTQPVVDAIWARFPQADCNEPSQGQWFCALREGHQTSWMRSYDPTIGDLTSPTLNVNQTVAGSNVNFTASASDNETSTALIHIDYKIDDELWQPGAATFTVPNSAEVVQVRAVDQAGNVSAVYSWTNPDPSDNGGNNGGDNGGNNGGNNGGDNGGTTPPTGTDGKTNPPNSITIGTRLTASVRVTPTKASGKRGWYKKPVTVAASGTAPAGTRALLQIRVNNKAWQTYTGPTKVKKNGKNVRIQARVIVLGTSTASPVDVATVKIDTKKPGKKKLKAKAKRKKAKKVIILKAKDKTSKIKKIAYKVNGKGKWKKFKKAKGIRITAKVKRIKFRAIDKAGNKSKAKTVKVKAAWRR